jgi:hypothetical protein
LVYENASALEEREEERVVGRIRWVKYEGGEAGTRQRDELSTIETRVTFQRKEERRAGGGLVERGKG